MAFTSVSAVMSAAQRATIATRKSETAILREARDSSSSEFDVFLCHSSIDRELVVGGKRLLEEKGLTVYVDWLEDPLDDRSKVTKRNAEKIRHRMRQCCQLIYLHTEKSKLSKWCPWELGYFDAYAHPQERVFIFPIIEAGETYLGQEYLGLYQAIGIDDVTKLPPIRKRPNPIEGRLLRDALGISPLRRPGYFL